MKKLSIISVLMCFTLLFSSCNKSDEKTVVAKVGKERITMAEFNEEYGFYLSQYNIEDDTAEDVAEDTESVRQYVIDYLIDQKIEAIWARELGLSDLTDEENTELKKDYDEMMDAWLEYFIEEALASDSSLSEEDAKAEGEKRIDEYLEENGYSNESFLTYQRELFVSQKLFDDITKDIAVSDDDVKTAFDENVASAKAKYETSPSQFEKDCLTEGEMIYYVPEGTKRVKHILTLLEQEDLEAISSLRSDGDEEGANKLRKEALKKIEDKAKAVLDSLNKDGSNFDEIMKEKSEDPGVANYPEGYVVTKQGKSYVDEFSKASLALEKPNDMTGLIGTDTGYHIIMLVEDIPSGAIEYDKIKETLKENMLLTKKQEDYAAKFQEKKEGIKIKVYNKKLRIPKKTDEE
ncbi:MAG: hypothetical protein GX967_03005 [Clostridiales bacterium]|nr:hypothetical protein [Clostridiales bacterium]